MTHAHPDHIGSAAWFQEHTDCRIYASEGEKRWIENIDLQFQERPIPNFYALAGRSSRVDVVVQNGDIIELEPGLPLEVIRTAGHSIEGLSYRLGKDMFIGDALPVLVDKVCRVLNQNMLKSNPLFATTVDCLREGSM